MQMVLALSSTGAGMYQHYLKVGELRMQNTDNSYICNIASSEYSSFPSNIL